MEQFSLEKYLENPNRKVVTRDGREVEILKVNAKGERPIIGVYPYSDTEDMESSWRIDGRKTANGESLFDLFFADEEEELTEFEKVVQSICKNLREGIDDISDIHILSNNLLNLARKELKYEMIEVLRAEYEKGRSDILQEFPHVGDTKAYQEGVKEGRRLERHDIDKELDEAYKSRDEVVYLEGYDQRKQDALKSLPKWKKVPEDKDFDRHVLLFEDEERVVLTTGLYKDEYYIELDDLKTLPKEE